MGDHYLIYFIIPFRYLHTKINLGYLDNGLCECVPYQLGISFNMKCWKGRTTLEATSGRAGIPNPSYSRNRPGVRPTNKKDVCKWSISLMLNTKTSRWHVKGKPDCTYLQQHNHELILEVAALATRKARLPEAAKAMIRSMAKANIRPYYILGAVKAHFLATGVKLPNLTLDDIAAICNGVTTRDQGQLNAAQKALSILLNLQRKDPRWVVNVR
jgi:hypothetical protein